MMNKATALDERHQTITWGAAQLGIGQGVLDAVADGLIEATGDLLVLVAVWVDPRADDETAVRDASRAAVRKAIGICVEGRDPDAAARARRRARHADATRSTAAADAHHGGRDAALPLPDFEPPFRAAWDPVPRRTRRRPSSASTPTRA